MFQSSNLSMFPGSCFSAAAAVLQALLSRKEHIGMGFTVALSTKP